MLREFTHEFEECPDRRIGGEIASRFDGEVDIECDPYHWEIVKARIYYYSEGSARPRKVAADAETFERIKTHLEGDERFCTLIDERTDAICSPEADAEDAADRRCDEAREASL